MPAVSRMGAQAGIVEGITFPRPQRKSPGV
jgi:hypothetical protein